MAEKEVGKVSHYFDKAGVAVIKLSRGIKSGDAILIRKGDAEFRDVIGSMQIDHAPVDHAEAGQEVALKVSQKTKEGALVFKMEE